MTWEEMLNRCLLKPGAFLDFPFGPDVAVVKVKSRNGPPRIFAQFFTLRGEEKATLNCSREMGEVYRGLYPGAVVRGYHCPPVQQPYFNTVSLDGAVPEEELWRMTDHAYETVVGKFPKWVRRELEDLAEKTERRTEMEIVKKAEKLLLDCGEFTLASISETGYPRICVLSKIKSDGLKKVWCATGLSGTKVRHFAANPRAGVCFWRDGDSVTLLGEVAVKTDRETREEMWLDWFQNHFPGGVDDPEYCVLEFTAQEATLWIGGEFVTVEGKDL